MDDNNFTHLVNQLFGGGGVAVVSSMLGRMMYHVTEVKKGKRKLFGIELIWELPTAIGMGVIGAGIAEYFGFEGHVSTAIIVSVGYIGPHIIDVALDKWTHKK